MRKDELIHKFTSELESQHNSVLINLLETFEYFVVPGNREHLDYSKVMLFFCLYSHAESAEDEEARQNLLFNML